MAATSAANAWAVGVAANNGSGDQTLVLRWNGTVWAQVPSPSPGTNDGLFGVGTTSPGNVWAVGSYALGGTSQAFAIHCC